MAKLGASNTGGFLGLLTLLLVALKGLGRLHCSWLWVFAPVWAVLIGLGAFAVLCALVGWAVRLRPKKGGL